MIDTAFVDGMVLASRVLAEREAAIAGASPGLARAFVDRDAALDELSREKRHVAVRSLVTALGTLAGDAELPARAGGVLASEAPSPLSERLASAAPPVRRGFHADRSLKVSLRRLAPATLVELKSEEIAPLEGALSAEHASSLRAYAAKLGPREKRRALDALILGVHGRTAGDDESQRLCAIGAELAEVWRAAWRG